MFRRKDPHGSLFEASNLFPEEKRERLRHAWPHAFRTQALPLIDENSFRDLFCNNNGRPNKPVQTVIGILILKDMWDLTDLEALYRVDFDLGWHHALGLAPEDSHCCQKTLHNFRAKLMASDRAKQLFADMTDRIIGVLGIRIDKQRLDSTHILSNIAILTRLGLFCETIRVFLRDVKQTLPERWQQIPPSLRARYLKDDGADTIYHDASKTEARRRLAVCARDLWRLCERFRGDEPVSLASHSLLQRLFAEQCEILDAPAKPAADDADRDEEPVPVQLKENRKVSGASLQSPHDADATYGHKGKGYEVQVAETCGNGDKPEIITYVDVTSSAGSDATQTVPIVDALAERGLQPKELVADTTYGSTENVLECAMRGTELIAPVPGPKVACAAAPEPTCAAAPEPTCAAAPEPCAAAPEPTCAAAPEPCAAAPEPTCAAAPEPTCAAAPEPCAAATEPKLEEPKQDAASKSSTKADELKRRRQYQATPEFRKRYAPRAGIEGTNSELKRGHGMRKLRVRQERRVRLAVYFKALACNVKRLLGYLVERVRETAASPPLEAAMAPA